MILLAVLSGTASGVATGITPGIHINLISALLVTSAPIIIPLVGLPAAVAFIIAMSVTHTFIDIIPTVYLGAPSADTVLGVLPGHRFLLRGEGLNAVRLTQIGGLGAAILSIGLFPIFMKIVEMSLPFLDDFLPQILLGLVLFLLLLSPKKSITVCLFLLSGLLGSLVFSLPGLQNPLFPMLSGLFGVSTLMMSMEESGIPLQSKKPLILSFKEICTAIGTGQAAGFLTAVFPGLGSASAAALSSAFVRFKESGFLILIGSIGTVNFLLSMVTYAVIDKARNGSIVAIRQLVGASTPSLIVLCVAVALLSAGLASLLLTLLAPQLAQIILKLPYKAMVKSVIFAITALAGVLSGWFGLLILMTSTALGLLAPKLGVQRIYLMGCLLVPVLLYLL